jgi:hypothetical protein
LTIAVATRGGNRLKRKARHNAWRKQGKPAGFLLTILRLRAGRLRMAAGDLTALSAKTSARATVNSVKARAFRDIRMAIGQQRLLTRLIRDFK